MVGIGSQLRDGVDLLVLTIAKHALFVGGLLGLAYGSWLIYRPAGFVIGGLLLIALAFLVDRSATK